MQVELSTFVQQPVRRTAEFREVRAIAGALLELLNERTVLARIAAANQPGQSSALVQAAFREAAERLGFQSEAKGLFAHYETRALRPDYYMPVAGTGILLEVERGKTTIN